MYSALSASLSTYTRPVWQDPHLLSFKWLGSKGIALVTPIASAIDTLLNAMIDSAYLLKGRPWKKLPSDTRSTLRCIWDNYAQTRFAFQATLGIVGYSLLWTKDYQSRVSAGALEIEAEQIVQSNVSRLTVYSSSPFNILGFLNDLPTLPPKALLTALQIFAWYTLGRMLCQHIPLPWNELQRLLQKLPARILSREESAELINTAYEIHLASKDVMRKLVSTLRLPTGGLSAALQLYLQRIQQAPISEEGRTACMHDFVTWLRQIFPTDPQLHAQLPTELQQRLQVLPPSPANTPLSQEEASHNWTIQLERATAGPVLSPNAVEKTFDEISAFLTPLLQPVVGSTDRKKNSIETAFAKAWLTFQGKYSAEPIELITSSVSEKVATAAFDHVCRMLPPLDEDSLKQYAMPTLVTLQSMLEAIPNLGAKGQQVLHAIHLEKFNQVWDRLIIELGAGFPIVNQKDPQSLTAEEWLREIIEIPVDLLLDLKDKGFSPTEAQGNALVALIRKEWITFKSAEDRSSCFKGLLGLVEELIAFLPAEKQHEPRQLLDQPLPLCCCSPFLLLEEIENDD